RNHVTVRQRDKQTGYLHAPMPISVIRRMVCLVPVFRFFFASREAAGQQPQTIDELAETTRTIEESLRSIESLVTEMSKSVESRLQSAERLAVKSIEANKRRLNALTNLVAMANVISVTRLIDFELDRHPRYSD